MSFPRKSLGVVVASSLSAAGIALLATPVTAAQSNPTTIKCHPYAEPNEPFRQGFLCNVEDFDSIGRIVITSLKGEVESDLSRDCPVAPAGVGSFVPQGKYKITVTDCTGKKTTFIIKNGVPQGNSGT